MKSNHAAPAHCRLRVAKSSALTECPSPGSAALDASVSDAQMVVHPDGESVQNAIKRGLSPSGPESKRARFLTGGIAMGKETASTLLRLWPRL